MCPLSNASLARSPPPVFDFFLLLQCRRRGIRSGRSSRERDSGMVVLAESVTPSSTPFSALATDAVPISRRCFNVASGILASSIALNALSLHGTCTVVFAACAAVMVALVASIRTFHHIAPVGWVGIICIIPAILLVTIACGISDRPPAAPAGIFDKKLRAFGSPSFSQAMVAVVNVLYAYSGSPGYFQIRVGLSFHIFCYSSR